MAEKPVGTITHYFSKIGVAVIELEDELKVGDVIHVKGHTSDFEQKIDSMQIEHETVEAAKAGQAVGLRVNEHVREHDAVSKVIEE
jgi:translation elongation factor EF-1alpha